MTSVEESTLGLCDSGAKRFDELLTSGTGNELVIHCEPLQFSSSLNSTVHKHPKCSHLRFILWKLDISFESS